MIWLIPCTWLHTGTYITCFACFCKSISLKCTVSSSADSLENHACMLWQFWPNYAIWPHKTWSTLDQIMFLFRMFGDKPLSEPILTWCQSNKLQDNINFNTKVFIQQNSIYRLQNCSHLVQSRPEWIHFNIIEILGFPHRVSPFLLTDMLFCHWQKAQLPIVPRGWKVIWYAIYFMSISYQIMLYATGMPALCKLITEILEAIIT